MAQVVIVLGSESDKEIAEKSKMIDVFNRVGVEYEVSVFSAHRNPCELKEYCGNAVASPTIFIAVAGMAAALPGAISAEVRGYAVVIGVPLSSASFGVQDALLSMIQMPKGIPVAVSGANESGLYNAAIMACQMIALGDEQVRAKLQTFLKETNKPPKTKITLS